MAAEIVEPPVLVDVSSVTKTYPGVIALKDVSIRFGGGEVHALVGENGAGKSTLMKVVAGAVAPDSGDVRICDQLVQPGNPRASAAAGVAMIYQELTIAPAMSAARNVLLGDMPHRFGMIDWQAVRSRFSQLSQEIGIDIDARLPAGSLSVAKQQLLEVMRALAAARQVVVFDEPTASLGPGDRSHLHQVVNRLRQQGRSVVYITHDLDEVLSLSDRVTVMRDGSIVETGRTSTFSKAGLVKAMLGRTLAPASAPRVTPAPHGEPFMQVSDLSASGGVSVSHLEVRSGEIVGIGGLVGSGRTELARALAGADSAASGHLLIDGRHVPWPRSVPRALGVGIAMVPEDRKAQGLCLGQSAAFNVVLSDLGAMSDYFWVNPRRALDAATAPAKDAGFDPFGLARGAGTFSGGNQQRILLARWMHRRPRLLILDEPTRGIDIGAKQAVFLAMRRLADEGMAILLVSSDLEEVASQSDRVFVMSRGRLVAALPAPTTVEAILSHSFGVDVASAASSTGHAE